MYVGQKYYVCNENYDSLPYEAVYIARDFMLLDY
jgi:hypothetical protein